MSTGPTAGLIALTLICGMVLPLQALINARLGTGLRGVEWAATASFAIGTLALLAIQTIRGIPWPSFTAAAHMPAWVWVGGLLGAFYVTASIVAAPRLGGALFVALLVTGQMAAAMALDHFGVLVARTPISPSRVLGALLIVAGVALIMRRP